MKIHWEQQGDYNFDPNKRYVVYYPGCFGPPHRGHFNTAKRFLDAGENISVIIHQKGLKSRHNVPYEINKKIWEIYIDELLPRERVVLIRNNGRRGNVLDHPLLKRADVVLMVCNNESGGGVNQQFNNHLCQIFGNMIRRLRRIKIEPVIFVGERPTVKTLSATKFVETIIGYKEGRISRDRLSYFLPDGLPSTRGDEIISRLSSCYVKV